MVKKMVTLHVYGRIIYKNIMIFVIVNCNLITGGRANSGALLIVQFLFFGNGAIKIIFVFSH